MIALHPVGLVGKYNHITRNITFIVIAAIQAGNVMAAISLPRRGSVVVKFNIENGAAGQSLNILHNKCEF